MDWLTLRVDASSSGLKEPNDFLWQRLLADASECSKKGNCAATSAEESTIDRAGFFRAHNNNLQAAKLTFPPEKEGPRAAEPLEFPRHKKSSAAEMHQKVDGYKLVEKAQQTAERERVAKHVTKK